MTYLGRSRQESSRKHLNLMSEMVDMQNGLLLASRLPSSMTRH